MVVKGIVIIIIQRTICDIIRYMTEMFEIEESICANNTFSNSGRHYVNLIGKVNGCLIMQLIEGISCCITNLRNAEATELVVPNRKHLRRLLCITILG